MSLMCCRFHGRQSFRRTVNVGGSSWSSKIAIHSGFLETSKPMHAIEQGLCMCLTCRTLRCQSVPRQHCGTMSWRFTLVLCKPNFTVWTARPETPLRKICHNYCSNSSLVPLPESTILGSLVMDNFVGSPL